MTVTDRDQSACFEEIRQLRQISHRVNIGLNNQQQLLQMRDLSLAPDVIAHVHLVDLELATLETHLPIRGDRTRTTAGADRNLGADQLVA